MKTDQEIVMSSISFTVNDKEELFNINEEYMDMSNQWILFFDESGCLFDDYIPKDYFGKLAPYLYSPIEGVYAYEGTLLENEIIDTLIKLGFNND